MTKHFMVYHLYFLKSQVNGDLYIGSCEDLEKRLARHNGGYVRSTKAYRPWKLVGYEKDNSRSEAMRREKFFKTGQQKEILKQKYKDV